MGHSRGFMEVAIISCRFWLESFAVTSAFKLKIMFAATRPQSWRPPKNYNNLQIQLNYLQRLTSHDTEELKYHEDVIDIIRSGQL